MDKHKPKYKLTSKRTKRVLADNIAFSSIVEAIIIPNNEYCAVYAMEIGEKLFFSSHYDPDGLFLERVE